MAAFRSSMALRSYIPTARLSTSIAARRAQTLPPKVSTFGVARSYATDNASAVAAPDYLDESERKIFGILKDSLKPEKLEVGLLACRSVKAYLTH